MPQREPQSGWFVEVPASLKQEFKALYKGRAAMRKLTIAAIKFAIKEHPNLKPKEGKHENQEDNGAYARPTDSSARSESARNDGYPSSE